MNYLSIGEAFIEGVGLILSPCILPILPIMLAGGAAAGRKRPYGIIVGFVLMFSVVTLFLREILAVTGVMPSIILHVSFVLLIVFGIVMWVDTLSNWFTRITSRLAAVGSQSSSLNNPDGGFMSGVLLGAIVSLVWTPCAGPLLAAVIVETITSQTNFTSFLVVIAFAAGSGIPMLIITLLGRKVLHKLTFLQSHPRAVKKVLGAVLIISAILLATGVSTRVVTDVKPVQINKLSLKPQLIQALSRPYAAPKIQNIAAWINSKPLTLNELKGKVVLIDFWTYSCINCIRTIPDLNTLYRDYHQQGLVIIGVHSPEFPFEHKLANVQAAVQRFHIHYPVALDNDFTTFTNFHNSYWPAHYLINRQGQVVYTHFGEGNAQVLQHNVRVLLGLADVPQKSPDAPMDLNLNYNQTPETYLGLERQARYAGTIPLRAALSQYHYPDALPLHYWALSGAWRNTKEYLLSAGKASAIKLHFNAKQVYIVAGTYTDNPVVIHVLLNGKPIKAANSGVDVHHSTVTIKGQRLYGLVKLPASENATLEITVDQPNFSLYTFTFG